MKKATREQTKKHNTQLVLRTIYHGNNISRADIARVTHLTRPTVSSIVAELLKRGFIVETGQGPSAGGKPPTLLNIAENAYQLLCIDLGSRHFHGAIVNLRGEILERISFPSDSQTREEALGRVYELIDALIEASTAPLLGIGIGTPGLIDPAEGVIRRAVNLEWTNLPLRRLLEDHYQKPVYVANDSHMATLAEYTFGEGRESNNLILIKIGQGIGAGIVLGGQIYSGDGFGAGEIGHLVVAENGEQCTCGNVGCLETTTSTRAILQRARQAAQSGASPIRAAAPEITWETLERAFQAGDEATRRIIHDAGKYLGVAIASLIASFNIRRVVISGRVSRFGDAILAAAYEESRRRALSTLVAGTDICYSTFDTDIVLLGCSAMILNRELGVI